MREFRKEEICASAELPDGITLLRGLYTVDFFLVSGGFGMTYLAHDTLDRRYVIKECYPDGICQRTGLDVGPATLAQTGQYDRILQQFLGEARQLARLDHPHIVRVHQVFEENGTAYMVMEVVDGVDLLTVLEDEPERLTPDFVRAALVEALGAIRYIHDRGILHRDISPDNLLIGPDDRLTLIDFGAAWDRSGEDSKNISRLLAVKDGYSPHEFYLTDEPQTEASDLYSLGATFYHLITGEAPPNSNDRMEETSQGRADPYVPLSGGDWDYDAAFLEVIDRALSLDQGARISCAADWLSILEGDSGGAGAVNDDVEPELLEAAPEVEPESVEPQEGDAAADETGVDAVIEPEVQSEPEQTQPFGAAEPFSEAPRVDHQLKTAISNLVEATNRDLVQGKPGMTKKAKGRARPGGRKLHHAVEERPAQPVDMFGNPIQDVEAWLRDQERTAKNRNRAELREEILAHKQSRKKAERKKKLRDGQAVTEGRKTSLGQKLAAYFSSRRSDDDTPSAAQN